MPLPEDQGPGRDIHADRHRRHPGAFCRLEISPSPSGEADSDRLTNTCRQPRHPSTPANNQEWRAEFEAPESLQRNVIYFHGLWAIGSESARHAVETDHLDHYLALKYSARSVNAVLTSDSGETYQVIVTVNGDYLTEENKGADVIIADDGVSYIEVIDPKLYRIVEHPTWEGSQVLKLSSTSDDFGLFSFTFGVYEDGF